MRVLVTGHRGYLGAVLVPLLRRAGHVVVGLDSGLFRRCRFGPAECAAWELECDLRDVQRSDLEGFQAVIHLAGLAGADLAARFPRLAVEVDHRAASRLAGVARSAGVERFIHASPAEVYAPPADPTRPVNEDDPLGSASPWADAQASLEEDLSWLAGDRFSPVSLRLAPVFGYSPSHRLDLPLNALVAEAHTTGRITLAEGDESWAPLVHVEDVARAFVCALTARRRVVHGQAFNVTAAGEPLRRTELIALVQRLTRCQVRRVPAVGQPRPTCPPLDAQKIGERLGFQPIWGARLGILELLSAYRLHRLTAAEVHADRYRRAAHLERLLRSGALSADLRPTTASTAALARASA